MHDIVTLLQHDIVSNAPNDPLLYSNKFLLDKSSDG